MTDKDIWLILYLVFCEPGAIRNARQARIVTRKKQASPGVLLGFADRQIHTSLAIVWDALFFAELFDFFNIQRDTDVWNAPCLKLRN